MMQVYDTNLFGDPLAPGPGRPGSREERTRNRFVGYDGPPRPGRAEARRLRQWARDEVRRVRAGALGLSDRSEK
jgi:hypothetical protein